MKLVAMVTDPKSVARYLAGIGKLVDVPGRSHSRGPPYSKSVLPRRNRVGLWTSWRFAQAVYVVLYLVLVVIQGGALWDSYRTSKRL